MKHFSTFSQRPSPQAPWHASQKMLQIMAMRLDKVSSRLDQMAPQLCPFEISKNNFESIAKKMSTCWVKQFSQQVDVLGKNVYFVGQLVDTLGQPEASLCSVA